MAISLAPTLKAEVTGDVHVSCCNSSKNYSGDEVLEVKQGKLQVKESRWCCFPSKSPDMEEVCGVVLKELEKKYGKKPAAVAVQGSEFSRKRRGSMTLAELERIEKEAEEASKNWTHLQKAYKGARMLRRMTAEVDDRRERASIAMAASMSLFADSRFPEARKDSSSTARSDNAFRVNPFTVLLPPHRKSHMKEDGQSSSSGKETAGKDLSEKETSGKESLGSLLKDDRSEPNRDLPMLTVEHVKSLHPCLVPSPVQERAALYVPSQAKKEVSFGEEQEPCPHLISPSHIQAFRDQNFTEIENPNITVLGNSGKRKPFDKNFLKKEIQSLEFDPPLAEEEIELVIKLVINDFREEGRSKVFSEEIESKVAKYIRMTGKIMIPAKESKSDRNSLSKSS